MVRSAAAALRAAREELAALITREMGKPLAEARAEVNKCAWTCEYYADESAGFLADDPVESGAKSSWVAYEPLGVVLAVMPWNSRSGRLSASPLPRSWRATARC